MFGADCLFFNYYCLPRDFASQTLRSCQAQNLLYYCRNRWKYTKSFHFDLECFATQSLIKVMIRMCHLWQLQESYLCSGFVATSGSRSVVGSFISWTFSRTACISVARVIVLALADWLTNADSGVGLVTGWVKGQVIRSRVTNSRSQSNEVNIEGGKVQPRLTQVNCQACKNSGHQNCKTSV